MRRAIMSTMFARLPLILLVATCAITSVSALAGENHHEHHPRVPVPPTDEIEILDPNVDPTGKPAVLLHPSGDGQMQVDIPQTVLVHKYYYTGDRNFQAQLLPGGPSIIVANHPKTGERCYISVTMLPGAPRVTYTAHSIEYDYGPQGMCVTFPPFCKPRVVYRNGVPLSRKTANVVHSVNLHAQDLAYHTHQVLVGAKNVTVNVSNGVHDVGKQVLAPVHAVVQMTPIGSLFQSDPARQAERARDEAVTRAQKEATLRAADIQTLR